MATTRFAHNAVPMERDFYANEDYVLGWSARQYVTAWTYFDDSELVMDSRLHFLEQAESFLAFLTDMQDAWNSQFPCPPLRGSMQVYAPDLSPVKMSIMRQVFTTLRVANER